MARVIQFYIPTNFKPKSRTLSFAEGGQLLEFPQQEPDGYRNPAWVFPEVDGDLSARKG